MITPDERGLEQPEITFSSRNLAIAQGGAEKTDPLLGAEELPLTFFTPRESEDILQAAIKMRKYVGTTDKVVYLKLYGGPLIVSAKISPAEAVKNFELHRVKRSREKLGVFWTDAEEKYNKLAAKISTLTTAQREQFLKDFKAKRKSVKDFGAITAFILEPSLDLAMDLAGELPGSNVAEQLTSLVERISALLPQQ